MRERLAMFAREDIDVRRVALNFDQVQLYSPPPNLAKETVASPQLLKTKEPGFRQDATAVASRRRAGRETRLRFGSLARARRQQGQKRSRLDRSDQAAPAAHKGRGE